MEKRENDKWGWIGSYTNSEFADQAIATQFDDDKIVLQAGWTGYRRASSMSGDPFARIYEDGHDLFDAPVRVKVWKIGKIE